MAILIFILGLLFGSFYLVVGLRLPKGEDALFSRSHCDNCQHILKWYNLIPIFSFLGQKGKCPLNIIVELATGFLFALGYLMYGLSYEFYLYLIVVSLMILIFITDFIYLIILDSPLIIGAILVIILKFIYLGLMPTLASILNGILLFLVMYLIQFLGSKLFKKESLGGGDVKFAFLIGLILDFPLGLVTLILSTFLALPYSVATLYMTKNHEVPYGPFLVGALFIVIVFLDKFKALLLVLFP